MRKSIFFKNLKTSIKSPPGGAGEYNMEIRCTKSTFSNKFAKKTPSPDFDSFS